MKTFVTCGKCGFNISQDMKHAIESGICPKCGEKMEVADLPSAFILIDIIQELKLPLNASQISDLLDSFLIKRLNMSFPKITIVNDPADKIRAAANLRPVSELFNDNIDPLAPLPPKGIQVIGRKKPLPSTGMIPLPPAQGEEQAASQPEYEGPMMDVSEEEAAQLKADMEANAPIAPLPDPKKFGSASDGIAFFDPKAMSGRGPMLHGDIGHKLNVPRSK